MAYIPDSDTDRGEVLRKFLELAEVGKVPNGIAEGHHDGWGIASYARGVLLRHFRTEESGATSQARDKELFLAATHKPDVMLAHVRKMSIGGLHETNNHPFIAGRFAFIHNGTLGHVDQQIFDPVRGRVFGETDSEYYFHLIIQDLNLNEEHNKEMIISVIRKTVQTLRIGTSHGGGGFTSASSILTDGTHAYVLREYDEQHPLVKKHNAEGYYSLFLGQGPRDERIVCSEELHLPEVTWELLPNHTITVVDLRTGAFETHPV